MKNATNFYLSLIVVTSTMASALAAQATIPDSYVIQCDDMAKHEAKSWSQWAESKGLTNEVIYRSASNTCLSGLLVARDAKNISAINDWSVDSFNRNAVLGLSALNINSVQKATTIANNYFKELHGDTQTQKESKDEYPYLRPDATEQEKVSAMNSYAESRKIRGISIKSTCESAVAINDFTYGFSSSEKERAKSMSDVAISACKAVMVNNKTNGKHGLSSDKILSSLSMQANSAERTYIKRVVSWAWQESK